VTEQPSYGSPAAFRRALTDRLKASAAASKWNLAQLQRQLAYDRLLERLYLLDDGWIVKGATALLARNLGMRATIDVDVYREKTALAAEAEFRTAVGREVGDWFRFEVGTGRVIGEGENGVRLPVTAHLGATPWARFHVDLVGADLRMTGEPERVPPLAGLSMADLEQHGYRAYPLADHLADKVMATFQRYGPQRLPSTRFKDLVDLVSIVRGAELQAEPIRRALLSEADRRNVVLQARFKIPDRRLWEPGYAAEARRSFLPSATTRLDNALAVVSPFLDPLLNGSASGTWRPVEGIWASDPDG